MIRTDRDALVCDLAETYGLFDMRALPASTLATLCVGLREDSRIKTRLFGDRIPRSDVLLAAVVDRLSLLIWKLFGQEGSSPPGSVLDSLLGVQPQESDVERYDSPEDFESEWKKRTGVSHGIQ